MEITQYLKPEHAPLLTDMAVWNKEAIAMECAICGEVFNEDDRFILSQIIDEDFWYAVAHYSCAFMEEYVEQFQTDMVGGFLILEGE